MALSGTLAQTFVANMSDLDTYARTPLGSTMMMEDGRGYKYVQFSGATAIAAGQVVCYTAADTTETLVDLANTARGAGAAVVAVPAGVTQFGWIQTKGLATLPAAVTGAVAGSPVTTQGATAGGMLITSVLTNPVYGKALTTTLVSFDFPW
jgi:hypothetical protein